MPKSAFHVADLGLRWVQINFALGWMWTEEHKKTCADALFRITTKRHKHWQTINNLATINLLNDPIPIRLNNEITVDYDGTLYGGNTFLHASERKEKFVIGHLDDVGSFDRYGMDSPINASLLEWSDPADVTANDLVVGEVMISSVKWMQRDGVPGFSA